MIEHVDRAVERFFQTRASLQEASVAISFETPDRDFEAGRTRPTVSVFLWEIGRSPKTLRSGMEQRVDESGARQRRPVTPIVDLCYVVTAWANEPRDEHQLLGSLLQSVLAHSRLPDDVLPEALAGMRCGLSLAPAGTRAPGELWTAFGSGPRPAIYLEVSLPLEVFAWREVAAPAETIELGVGPRPAAATPEPDPDAPSFTRRRANGALLMEGHAERRGPGS